MRQTMIQLIKTINYRRVDVEEDPTTLRLLWAREYNRTIAEQVQAHQMIFHKRMAIQTVLACLALEIIIRIKI
jgi:hypothetical protein